MREAAKGVQDQRVEALVQAVLVRPEVPKNLVQKMKAKMRIKKRKLIMMTNFFTISYLPKHATEKPTFLSQNLTTISVTLAKSTRSSKKLKTKFLSSMRISKKKNGLLRLLLDFLRNQQKEKLSRKELKNHQN